MLSVVQNGACPPRLTTNVRPVEVLSGIVAVRLQLRAIVSTVVLVVATLSQVADCMVSITTICLL